MPYEEGYLIPLSALIGAVWPTDLVELPAGLEESLAGIGIARMDLQPPTSSNVVVVIREAASIEMPGLSGLEFVIGAPPRTPGTPPPQVTVIEVGLDLAPPFKVSAALLLELRFPADVVQALRRVGTPPTQTYEMEADPRAYVQLDARFSINGNGDVFFSPVDAPEFNLPPLSIGGRPPAAGDEGRIGFILDIPTVALILDEPTSIPEGMPVGFRGVFIPSAMARLPPDMNVPGTPSFDVTNAGLGTGGFSGRIAVDFPGTPPEASLFGIGFRLRSVSLTFAQGTLTEGGFAGEIFLPFFDRWLGATVTIDQAGDFAVTINTTNQETSESSDGASGTPDGLLVLEKPEVMRLQLDSLGLARHEENYTITLGGRVRPLVGGIDWPEFEIKGITIFPNGSVKIDGGWVDLPTTQTVNFFGFRLSVSRLGFGSEHDGGTDYEWFGADGELALVEGLPIATSVQGLKFRWPKGYPEQLSVTLEGVGISLEIPGTLELDGSVAFITRQPGEGLAGLAQERFEGVLRLTITPLRMEVSAQVLVAQVDFPEGRRTAFMIVLDTSFPTGILIGATGLSIYGLSGLFVMHMAPDRLVSTTTEKSWYQWWKDGLTDSEKYTVATISKWEPELGTFAFGLGAQFGTAIDDGHSLNANVLLAVVVPGPIVIIDGKLNFLRQRGSRTQEGAFHVLVVVDGRAGTFLLAIDIKYSIEDIFEIEGGAEAFFNFNNSDDWHIYIGQNDPETKRIRGRILSLVEASTYFMMDPRQLAFGATANLGFRGEYGPLQIILEVALGFDLIMAWKPLQMTGEIFVRGELAVKVFGIGIGLLIEALLAGSTPSPYHILGTFHCKVELFWPLPTLEADVRLEWGPTGAALPVDPFFKRAVFVHRKAPGKSWELGPAGTVLPADAVIALSFNRPIGQVAVAAGAVAPPPRTDEVDGRTFRYDVVGVTLEVMSGGVYVPFANMNGTAPKVFPLLGERSLLAPPNAQEPALALWTLEPYPGASSLSLPDTLGHEPPCGTGRTAAIHLVDWGRVPNGTRYPFEFTHMRLAFSADLDAGLIAPVVASTALRTPNAHVRFPETVTTVTIKFQTGFSATVWLAVFSRGVQLSRQLITITSTPQVTVPSPAGTPIDALRIEPANAQIPSVLVAQITYVTERESNEAGRGAAPTSPSSEGAAYGTPFLDPARQYRLIVRTAVSVDGGAPVAQTPDHIFEFRTLPGPGIETRPLVGGLPPPPAANEEDELRDSILNRLETFIAETLPLAGARVFYPDEDLAVAFDNPYAPSLYSSQLALRVLDSEATIVASGAAITALGRFWRDPFYLSWLAGLSRGGCGLGSVTTPRTAELRLAVAGLKARAPYTVQVASGTTVLHSYPAVTSRYAGLATHLDDVLRTGSDVVVVEREVTAALPLAWVSSVSAARTALDTALAALGSATDALTWHDRHATATSARQALVGAVATAYSLVAASAPLSAGPPDVPRVELTRLHFSDGARALVIDSPEPLPISRMTSVLRRAGVTVASQLLHNGDGTRIVLVPQPAVLTPGAFSVTWQYSSPADMLLASRNYVAINDSITWNFMVT